MAVVDVRVVRMLVSQRPMPVGMHVGFVAFPGEVMLMLVVIVVAMRMRVRERLVGVDVLVPLPQVQPDAGCHQRCRDPE